MVLVPGLLLARCFRCLLLLPARYFLLYHFLYSLIRLPHREEFLPAALLLPVLPAVVFLLWLLLPRFHFLLSFPLLQLWFHLLLSVPVLFPSLLLSAVVFPVRLSAYFYYHLIHTPPLFLRQLKRLPPLLLLVL